MQLLFPFQFSSFLLPVQGFYDKANYDKALISADDILKTQPRHPGYLLSPFFLSTSLPLSSSSLFFLSLLPSFIMITDFIVFPSLNCNLTHLSIFHHCSLICFLVSFRSNSVDYNSYFMLLFHILISPLETLALKGIVLYNKGRKEEALATIKQGLMCNFKSMICI